MKKMFHLLVIVIFCSCNCPIFEDIYCEGTFGYFSVTDNGENLFHSDRFNVSEFIIFSEIDSVVDYRFDPSVGKIELYFTPNTDFYFKIDDETIDTIFGVFHDFEQPCCTNMPLKEIYYNGTQVCSSNRNCSGLIDLSFERI